MAVEPVIAALVFALESLNEAPEDQSIEDDAVFVRDVLAEKGVELVEFE